MPTDTIGLARFRPVHRLQELSAAIALTVKDCLSHSALLFELSLAPLIYAVVSIYLFRDQQAPNTVFYVLLGAGAMGMWESTLLGGAWTLRDDKEQGLLEYHLCAPSSLPLVIFGKCLVYTAIGLLVMVEVFVILAFEFDLGGLSIHFGHLLLAFVMLVISFSITGFCLSFAFLLFRSFIQLSNFLSDSIKLVCGVLFPITVLPPALRAVSVLLPPTWGIELVRTTTIGGSHVSFARALGCVSVLTLLFATLAVVLFRTIHRRIRANGDLSHI